MKLWQFLLSVAPYLNIKFLLCQTVLCCCRVDVSGGMHILGFNVHHALHTADIHHDVQAYMLMV